MRTSDACLCLTVADYDFAYRRSLRADAPRTTEPALFRQRSRQPKPSSFRTPASDSGLFPEPFSGDPDRPYTEFYSALKATGDFTLVGDPAQADLVLELRLVAPYGPSEANKQKGASDPLPMFRVAIYDGKSHYILWTVTSSIELAYLQKTHDKNFDTALAEVLNQFLKIAGKPPAVAH